MLSRTVCREQGLSSTSSPSVSVLVASATNVVGDGEHVEVAAIWETLTISGDGDSERADVNGGAESDIRGGVPQMFSEVTGDEGIARTDGVDRAHRQSVTLVTVTADNGRRSSSTVLQD